MTTNLWISLSQRFYRQLLRLYPRAYRATYEMEMLRLFKNQCQDVYQQQGGLGILSLWLRTLADVVVTVIREHLSDPHAKLGLLDVIPNAPLPWKGVLLVLMPGLIFFISQVEQLISNNDWFFLVLFRAGYFLILPVLLVWLLTRRFPVWGLIPFGLLYETLWSYGQRFNFRSLPVLDRFFVSDTVVLFGTSMSAYDLKYLIMTPVCVILLAVFIWYNARRGQIPRSAWKWLGLYGLLILLGIVGEVYRFLLFQDQYWPPVDLKQYLLQMPLWYLYASLPFLLLIFIGKLFAQKYQGFSFLVLLGYLLPMVLFGRYGSWNAVVPFYLVGLAVLTYRFVVALVAPTWLVRAASLPSRQRAAAIPVAIAILCHLILSLIVALAWAGQSGYPISLLDLTMTVWDQLIIATGLVLAVNLYLPKEQDQASVSPPALILTTE